MDRDRSGPIILPIPGLLGFLQVKNEGENPRDLLNAVQPILNWDNWARQTEAFNYQLASYVGPTSIGIQVFNIVGLTVPAREWWWVRTLSLAVACGAASTLSAAVACREGGGGLTRVRFLTPTAAATANTQAYASASDIWLSPGTELLLAAADGSGITLSADAWVNYARFPI